MDGAINPQRLWILTGPTASGKSALSLEIARVHPVEIVNLDSMSIYRGMDIGTSKVPTLIRQEIPHHLIDVLDPWESGHIAWWLAQAHQTIAEIQSRGKIALLVGGTMLYLRAFLRGMDPGPPPDPEYRLTLENLALQNGPVSLFESLEKLDPVAAARIQPTDTRRVIRAMEILRARGQTASAQNHWSNAATRPEHGRWIGLDLPRPELRSRIATTVRRMIEQGWLDEVSRLMHLSQPWSREAAQAIGYSLLKRHLEEGGPFGPVTEKIVQGTCQFAKRQQTWMRSMSELQLLCPDDARKIFLE